MNRSLAPVLLLLTMVAGCADQTAGSSAGSTPEVSATAVTPVTGTTSTTTSSATVFPLDFSRTGGIAGFNDRLHIDADGTMTVSHKGVTGKPIATDATVLAALQQVLSAPNLAGATPSKASGICADGFVYALSTPSWTYTADDCTGDHPELERALDLLMPLLKS